MPDRSFSKIVKDLSQNISTYRQSIFTCFIYSMICSANKKCVSAIWERFSPLFCDEAVNSKRFYNFLNSSKLPWQKLRIAIIKMLGDRALTQGKVILAIDDSTYTKTGKKIEGAASHFDHAAKMNSSSYVWGHCRVVTGVLSFVKGRWAMIPLLQNNYVPVKQKADGKTKVKIAYEHVLTAAKEFTNEILVTCDSWFAVKTLIKEVQKETTKQTIHFLSRLRINSALCELPEQKKGGRGRPKKYGKRIESVTALASSLRNQSQKAQVFIYSKKREVEFSEKIVMSKALQQKVKVIFIYLRSGRVFPLITTDLDLDAVEAIEYYSARWKIESGFKEIKHELGALDNQCRKENAVEAHFNMACISMALTWIYAMNQTEPIKKRNSQSRHYSFADIRSQIESEIISEANLFNKLCPNSVKTAGKYLLNKILGRVA